MGPLAGYRIIEMAGIGPAPVRRRCCWRTWAPRWSAWIGREAADLGLPGARPQVRRRLHRGRRSIAVDLKAPRPARGVREAARRARPTPCIEGFRPGVMERLGLGLDICPGAATRGWSTAA